MDPIPGGFSWHPVAPAESFKCPILLCVQLRFHIRLLWCVFMPVFLTSLWTSWAQELMIMAKGMFTELGTMLSTLYARFHLILPETLWGRCSDFPHFIEKKTETQRGQVICPRLQSWEVSQPALTPGLIVEPGPFLTKVPLSLCL